MRGTVLTHAGVCRFTGAAQMLWAVAPNGTRWYAPDPLAPRTCVHFSNSTELLRPGLAAADSCDWELPFICECETHALPTSPPGPPGAYSSPTPKRSRSQRHNAPCAPPAAMLCRAAVRTSPAPPSPPPSPPRNATVYVTAVDVTQAVSQTGPSGGDAAAPQPSLPRLVTVPDTGVLMWAQPEADTPVNAVLAKQWCGIWNASLATVYNRTAQAALQKASEARSCRCPCPRPRAARQQAGHAHRAAPTAGRLLDDQQTRAPAARAMRALLEQVALASQAPYWLNLGVNRTANAWQWGAPNTPLNSSTYLAQWQGWCEAFPPAAQLGQPECSQLAFAPEGCAQYDPTGQGWGWFPRACNASGSYMCMASPRGARLLAALRWRCSGKRHAGASEIVSAPHATVPVLCRCVA